MPLVLTEADVHRVLTMDDLIEVMERAVVEFSAKRVEQPVRSILRAGSGLFGVMPASTPDPRAAGAKLVTLFHGNTEKGLPTHLATIALIDPDTGALIAMMDGRYITEARTAAVSAVSARYLAKPSASRLAILGTGVQARSHLDAIPRVLPIRDIRVWSPKPESRARFLAEHGPRTAVPLRATETPAAAVEGADVVIVAVATRPTPLLMNDWVPDGAHVVGLGAVRPHEQEIDPALVARARVFVDSRAAVGTEAGDLLIPIKEGRFGPDHVAGELGEVVSGQTPGRQDDRQVTFFKSLGMAVEDIAAAHLAFTRARAQGIGTMVQL
jgi:ornithine cyclodeaminase